MKLLVNFALLCSVALSSAALAEEQGAKGKKAKDPNRIICRSEPVIGSRLAREKRCLTALEWEEDRRLQRMTIDRAQALNYKNN